NPDLESGKYRIYVRAYENGNEDENCDSNDGDMSKTDYQIIEVKSNSNYVKISDFEMQETAECEGIVSLSFDLYNFGLGDDEDLRINIYNGNLGLDMYSEIVNIDEGDYEHFNFDF